MALEVFMDGADRVRVERVVGREEGGEGWGWCFLK